MRASRQSMTLINPWPPADASAATEKGSCAIEALSAAECPSILGTLLLASDDDEQNRQGKEIVNSTDAATRRVMRRAAASIRPCIESIWNWVKRVRPYFPLCRCGKRWCLGLCSLHKTHWTALGYLVAMDSDWNDVALRPLPPPTISSSSSTRMRLLKRSASSRTRNVFWKRRT